MLKFYSVPLDSTTNSGLIKAVQSSLKPVSTAYKYFGAELLVVVSIILTKSLQKMWLNNQLKCPRQYGETVVLIQRLVFQTEISKAPIVLERLLFLSLSC